MMISNSRNPPVAISRICGGIGNQLFIYAALRRLTLNSNAKLVVDNISGFLYDDFKRHYQLDHFHVKCTKASRKDRLEPFSKVRCKIKRYINKYIPYEKRNHIYQEGDNIFDPRFLQVKLTRRVHFEGYWQGEEYFKDIENIIRQDLVIKPPVDSINLSMAESIIIYFLTGLKMHLK